MHEWESEEKEAKKKYKYNPDDESFDSSQHPPPIDMKSKFSIFTAQVILFNFDNYNHQLFYHKPFDRP